MKKYVALSLLSVAGSASVAIAQEQTIETVTVTANKVTENVLDIPQSITVIDREILEEKGIDTVNKVIGEVPNMTVEKNNGFGSAVNFRGLNSSVFTNNNPVVIYIDGVPTTDRYTYQASLLNAKRVEVLRGPQGTLYGKDAIGGVINIVTEDSPDEVTGNVNLEYGNYDFIKSTINVSAPLIEDKLFMGISGSFDSDDGWVTNDYYNDDEAAKTENKSGSFYIKFNPSERSSLKYNYSRLETEDGFPTGGSVNPATDLNDLKRSDVEEASFDVPTYTDVEINAHSLAYIHEFDWFDLSIVGTHRKSELEGDYDADYGDNPFAKGMRQWSEWENVGQTAELRLSSELDGGAKWVAGIYLDDEEHEQGPYGQDSQSGEVNADSENQSNTYAIFGQTVLPLGANFDLTLGGRYQKIEKEIDVIATSPWSNNHIKSDKKWNEFLPKFAIAYHGFDSATSYLSVSKGYMPGGFNYFPNTSDVDENTFNPQESINYEIGIKGATSSLSYSANLFYMDIENTHVFFVEGHKFSTDNAESSRSYGLELEATYALGNNFDISASLGLLNAKYKEFNCSATISCDGKRIENTPSHTANLTFSYSPLEGVYGLVDINHRGAVYFFDSSSAKFNKADGYTKVNMKLGYRTFDWDIYAYVNNVTDEEYLTNYLRIGPLAIASFNDPRQFGIGARLHF